MPGAALPDDEASRLQALCELRLLDSAHEPVFDAITQLAASICETPIALVSLVDRERQWFKSRVGLDAEQTPREQAFCAHAILTPQLMEVDDALDDERFRDNPLVTGSPNIRFYAGMPLQVGAQHAVGTLCVLDRQPRRLTEAQRIALANLALVVERLFEARRETVAAEQSVRANEARTRAITDQMPAAIGYVDAGQRLRFANRLLLDLLGRGRADALGRSLAELHGPGYEARAAQVEDALAGREVRFDWPQPRGDPPRHFETRFVPDRDDDGAVHGFYGLTFDVTAQKAIERRLADSERRLRLIADNVPAAICYIDVEGRYRYNNAAYERWLARPLAEITGRGVRDVHGAESFAAIGPHIARALRGERAGFEVQIQKQGELRHLRGTYVPDFEGDGRVVGVFGLTQDATSLKLAEEQLQFMARNDALTGLANRYRLYEMLAGSGPRARRHGRQRALLYLDLDRFKAINDAFGHAVGDLVLCEFARRLRACVRESDTVARLAGDEFVILLEGLQDPADAHAVARKVLDAMGSAFDLGHEQLAVTTSVGVAFATPDDADHDAFLKRADSALYAAKAAGRNVYRIA